MLSRWRRSNLRARAAVVYISVAMLGLVGAVYAVVAFNQFVDARVRVTDQLSPATYAAGAWQAWLIDADGGVRAYLLTADDRRLGPYRNGLAAAERSEADIREALSSEPDLMERVDDVARSRDRWLEQARPLMDLTRDNGVLLDITDRLDQKERVFNEIRVEFESLQAAIDARHTEGRNAIDERTTELAMVLVGAMTVLVVGLVATWFALNRSVLDPLDELGGDAAQVAGGELGHRISLTGPPDVQRLADRMEAMRQRILDELAVVEDGRRQLEEQAADLERSNEELEQFAYVASHDLQEPLRKITGFCQLLERRYGDQLDDRGKEYIAFAVDGAKRMQLLINDLLTFSRVGRTTDSFVPVDLTQVAERVLANIDELVAETGATVVIGDLPTVAGDPTMLEVLIQNLITNGIKFRGDEAPVVEFAASRTNGQWEVTCRDNGIGIDPHYAERIFAIFQRLHDRAAYEGTGIGLAMCRKVVEFHGGEITVNTSHDGPGALIRFTLPVMGEDRSGSERSR